MENKNSQPNDLNLIEIGSKILATCSSLSHEGVGICKVDGMKEKELVSNFPIFINDFLPGEKGQIEITKLTKNYGFGKIIKIYHDTSSVDRMFPPCKNYANCGGCNIMHLKYQNSLKFKTEMVKETLRKLGGITDVKVNDTIGMSSPNYYRNKVQVPFRKSLNKTICGFFERDSHQVVPLTECLIQPVISTEIVNFIKNLCNEYKIDGYNEKDGTGLIRHVLVRTNFNLDNIMIVLVLTSNTIPHKDEIISKITKRYKDVKSIIVNINNKPVNTILGEYCNTIYGDDYIMDELCGLSFRIGPKSFYQVNHAQTERLYNKVAELASLNKDDILIDAYCGIGTIGLILSKHVNKVYSVEIVEEAIKNAKINAKINNIDNICFVCGKAEDQIVKWASENIKATTIVVDPPRKGCDIKLLNTIAEMNIKKIIYVSCDPATLARDLKILKEKGYIITTVQPIDMFPYTSNIETIVTLYKK